MFKKSISVLLAVLMICAVIPLSAIGASAASDTQTELTESLGTNDEPLELEIGTEFQDAFTEEDRSVTFRFVPKEAGCYVFNANADTYCDFELVDEDGALKRGVSGYANDFTLKTELEAGEPALVKLKLKPNAEPAEFAVFVEASASAQKIEITSMPYQTEYYADTLEDDLNFAGLELQITWSDGYTTDWSYIDYDKSPLRGDSFYWSVKDDNSVELSIGDCAVILPVDLIESPVEDIEVVGELPKLIKEGRGYWESDYDFELERNVDYFRYSLYELDDTTVIVRYKDGSTEERTINDFWEDDYVEVTPKDNARYYAVGDNNEAYLKFFGFKKSIFLTIVESPVKSIELVGKDGFSVIEDYDGYIDTKYNPETGYYDIEYFRYEIKDMSDAEIRINYKDGTSKAAKMDDTVDGIHFTTSDTQEDTPWTLGGEQYVTIKYLSTTIDVPVTVLPNPVDYIEIPDGEALTLYENTDGYWDTGWTEEDEAFVFYHYYTPDIDKIPVVIHYTDGTVKNTHIDEEIDGDYVSYHAKQGANPWTKGGDNFIDVTFFGRSTKLRVNIVDSPVKSIKVTSAPTREYILGDEAYGGSHSFYPSDLTGLAFTVYYTDGTSKKFTADDIDENDKLEGHFIEIEPPYDYEQRLGDNPFTLTYMGKSADFNVKVVESPVKSVKVTKAPKITKFSQYYDPDFDGAQVTITYKDGQTAVVDVTREMLTYSRSYLKPFCASFEVGDLTAMFIKKYNYEDDYESSAPFFTFTFAGVSCGVPQLVYEEQPYAENVEIEDYSPTGQNMLVKAEFKDGSKESLRLTDIFKYDFKYMPELSYYGAFTDKGILNYAMINLEDAEYVAILFGTYVKLGGESDDYMPGDITGDGKVSIEDATALQRYLAEFDGIDKTRVEKCGDVNRDGKINIEDVTFMQRFLAEFAGVQIG